MRIMTRLTITPKALTEGVLPRRGSARWLTGVWVGCLLVGVEGAVVWIAAHSLATTRRFHPALLDPPEGRLCLGVSEVAWAPDRAS